MQPRDMRDVYTVLCTSCCVHRVCQLADVAVRCSSSWRNQTHATHVYTVFADVAVGTVRCFCGDVLHIHTHTKDFS